MKSFLDVCEESVIWGGMYFEVFWVWIGKDFDMVVLELGLFVRFVVKKIVVKIINFRLFFCCLSVDWLWIDLLVWVGNYINWIKIFVIFFFNFKL